MHAVFVFKLCCADSSLNNLEGAQTELDAKPQAHVEVVWEEAEDHVMSAEERDEEEGGFGQSPEGRRDKGSREGRVRVLLGRLVQGASGE